MLKSDGLPFVVLLFPAKSGSFGVEASCGVNPTAPSKAIGSSSTYACKSILVATFLQLHTFAPSLYQQHKC